jgi:hypothetical protein
VSNPCLNSPCTPLCVHIPGGYPCSCPDSTILIQSGEELSWDVTEERPQPSPFALPLSEPWGLHRRRPSPLPVPQRLLRIARPTCCAVVNNNHELYQSIMKSLGTTRVQQQTIEGLTLVFFIKCFATDLFSYVFLNFVFLNKRV